MAASRGKRRRVPAQPDRCGRAPRRRRLRPRATVRAPTTSPRAATRSCATCARWWRSASTCRPRAGERRATAELLWRHFPTSLSAAATEAERWCEHRVEVLGCGETALGAEIDWHRDPVSRRGLAATSLRRLRPVARPRPRRQAGRGSSTATSTCRASARPTSSRARSATPARWWRRCWLDRAEPDAARACTGTRASRSRSARCRGCGRSSSCCPPTRSTKRRRAASASRCSRSSTTSRAIRRSAAARTRTCSARRPRSTSRGLLFPDGRRGRRWLEAGQDAPRARGAAADARRRHARRALAVLPLLRGRLLSPGDRAGSPLPCTARPGDGRGGWRRCSTRCARSAGPDGVVPLLGDDDGGRALALGASTCYRDARDLLARRRGALRSRRLEGGSAHAARGGASGWWAAAAGRRGRRCPRRSRRPIAPASTAPAIASNRRRLRHALSAAVRSRRPRQARRRPRARRRALDRAARARRGPAGRSGHLRVQRRAGVARLLPLDARAQHADDRRRRSVDLGRHLPLGAPGARRDRSGEGRHPGIRWAAGEHDGYVDATGLVHRRRVLSIDDGYWLVLDDVRAAVRERSSTAHARRERRARARAGRSAVSSTCGGTSRRKRRWLFAPSTMPRGARSRRHGAPRRRVASSARRGERAGSRRGSCGERPSPAAGVGVAPLRREAAGAGARDADGVERSGVVASRCSRRPARPVAASLGAGARSMPARVLGGRRRRKPPRSRSRSRTPRGEDLVILSSRGALVEAGPCRVRAEVLWVRVEDERPTRLLALDATYVEVARRLSPTGRLEPVARSAQSVNHFWSASASSAGARASAVAPVSSRSASMCGIAGIVRFERGASVEPAVLEAMTDALWHRGPDDVGYHFDGNAGSRHAPPEHHRPRLRPAAAAQRGRHAWWWCATERSTTIASCATSSAGAATRSAPAPTARRSFTPTRTGASASSSGCAACSASRCGTSAGASSSWAATGSASSRSTTTWAASICRSPPRSRRCSRRPACRARSTPRRSTSTSRCATCPGRARSFAASRSSSPVTSWCGRTTSSARRSTGTCREPQQMPRTMARATRSWSSASPRSSSRASTRT